VALDMNELQRRRWAQLVDTRGMAARPGRSAGPSQASGGWSVLDDFLAKTRTHERMGGVISPFLWRTALLADIFLLAVLLVGLQVDAAAVGSSGFFLVGGGLVGGLIGLIHVLTWPLLAIAAVGLGLKLWTRDRRTPGGVHVFCAMESVAALGTGLGWFLVVVAIAVELILWVLIILLMVALGVGIIAVLLAAAGS
jgi:hypothetical protein